MTFGKVFNPIVSEKSNTAKYDQLTDYRDDDHDKDIFLHPDRRYHLTNREGDDNALDVINDVEDSPPQLNLSDIEDEPAICNNGFDKPISKLDTPGGWLASIAPEHFSIDDISKNCDPALLTCSQKSYGLLRSTESKTIKASDRDTMLEYAEHRIQRNLARLFSGSGELAEEKDNKYEELQKSSTPAQRPD